MYLLKLLSAEMEPQEAMTIDMQVERKLKMEKAEANVRNAKEKIINR
jgi:hypothetical protein